MVGRLIAAASAAALGVLTFGVGRRDPSHSFAELTTGGTTVLLVAGWAAAGTALLLPSRRRGMAILLYLSGCAWFLSQWATPHTSPVVFTVGLLALGVVPALVTHAAAAHSGVTPAGQVVAAIGYTVTFGLQGVATALWFQPDKETCDCPTNLVALVDDPGRVANLERLGVWMGLLWSLAAAALLSGRLFSAGRGRLRAADVVTACGVAYAVLTAGYHAHSLEVGLLGTDPTDRRIWLAQGLVLMALSAAMVVGLARMRHTRRAMAGVVAGLSSADTDLRGDLATRLGDPTLAIGYPIDDGSHFVDRHGRSIDLRAGDGERATSLRRNETLLAVVRHSSAVDPRDVVALTSAVHLALERECLDARALVQLADLQASGNRIVAAGDAERRKVERDLHDGAQQHLVSLLLQTNALRAGYPDDTGLSTASAALETATAELRAIARRTSSVLLYSAGLRAALGALAETVPLEVTALPSGRLAAPIEATVYLLAEKACRTGPVGLSVDATDTRVRITMVAESRLELGELGDRVTTLDGTIDEEQIDDGRLASTVTLHLLAPQVSSSPS